MFTNSIDEGQKFTEAFPEDARYGAFTRGKNTYVRTWGLKRGRVFARGGAFLGTYGTDAAAMRMANPVTSTDRLG